MKQIKKIKIFQIKQLKLLIRMYQLMIMIRFKIIKQKIILIKKMKKLLISNKIVSKNKFKVPFINFKSFYI
jgi:hypothetical protein